MLIRIDPHTMERAVERGATEEEIREVIQTGILLPGKYGRMGKYKVYDFNAMRVGKFFQQKRVEVFYINQGDAIITVTVYVFYGKWEAEHANSL